MTENQTETYQQLLSRLRQTALLASCANLISWDEQTFMPPGGAEHRAEQLALLAGMVHERSTSAQLSDLIEKLEESTPAEDPDSPVAANIREARRNYDRATKQPRRLVEELARVCTLSQQAWVGARRDSDFPSFQPWLEKVVTLKREQAQAIGFGNGVPYDALLDEYEPGMTTAEVTALFNLLRDSLVPLVGAITEADKPADVSILQRSYPIDAQRQFSIAAATKIGFDFQNGRLDEATHPFCSGIGPGDTRLTTRYNQHHFPGAFFGTLHEAGHGIYDQGLDKTAFGTAMGSSISLGIHESQSRLWENFVGRSPAFWKHFYPPAQATFSEALTDVAPDDFYRAINDVRPSLIRVEADEATYNLHILLRFELEQPLVSGDLQPGDLPGVWNEKFSRYFGIAVPDDRRGCLQDIHWSGGMIGYFPTYALGNMYAAQFFQAAESQLGDLAAQFARGEFEPLKTWLNEQIHHRGRQYRAQQLVELVTGNRLSHEPLIAHLQSKYGQLYGL